MKSEKPATVTSAAPEPVVPETQMLPVMKVPMQYGTTGPSTVPPEPVVPETQMLPVMKVPMQYGTAGPSTVPPEPVVSETQVLPVMKEPMQYGTAGPSTVPATQISALISKDTMQNSTTLSTDKVAETPKNPFKCYVEYFSSRFR